MSITEPKHFGFELLNKTNQFPPYFLTTSFLFTDFYCYQQIATEPKELLVDPMQQFTA